MKVTICIGSSCHLKGSRQIVEQLQKLISEKNLCNAVELCGAFCMGNCTNGVCVKINDKMFSLKPENTEEFFKNEIIARLDKKQLSDKS
ncbi:MAG: (2Fe-2S) ferredoxin domain-containing protein [Oscillospiraceae bacterium]